MATISTVLLLAVIFTTESRPIAPVHHKMAVEENRSNRSADDQINLNRSADDQINLNRSGDDQINLNRSADGQINLNRSADGQINLNRSADYFMIILNRLPDDFGVLEMTSSTESSTVPKICDAYHFGPNCETHKGEFAAKVVVAILLVILIIFVIILGIFAGVDVGPIVMCLCELIAALFRN